MLSSFWAVKVLSSSELQLNLSAYAGPEDQVVEFRSGDSQIYFHPMSSGFQGQIWLSPVLKMPGCCGPLAVQAREPVSLNPSIFLPQPVATQRAV